MSLFRSLQCRLSSHQWKEWRLVENLQEARICGRCQKGETRLHTHMWSQWVNESTGTCEQMRTCNMCQTKETLTILHEWSEWEYMSLDSCAQIQTCVRCHKKGQERIEHHWSQWEYLSSKSCSQERVCNRCREKQESTEAHDWETLIWNNNTRTFYNRCKRCGYEVEEDAEAAAERFRHWEALEDDEARKNDLPFQDISVTEGVKSFLKGLFG